MESFWLLFPPFLFIFYFFFNVKPDGLSWDLFCGFDELKSAPPATFNGPVL